MQMEAAQQARKLVDNSEYLPTSLRKRQQARLDAIEADAQLVVREIERDQQLQTSLAQIQAATGEGQIAQAYDVRQQLLERYPQLASDDRLQQAVRGISQKEQELVREIPPAVAAVSQEHPSPNSARLSMADCRTILPTSSQDGHVIYYLLDGAAYGLEAGTGRPLWRRFVGHQSSSQPVALSGQPGADALVVDQQRQELLRIDAHTGRLVWRLSLGETAVAPVVVQERIILATRTGRLLQIDAGSGKPAAAVQLPQPVDVAPGNDPRAGVLYQLGSHSTLFAISATSLQCSGTFYLGHDPGSITAPPVVTMSHVFVAENKSSDYCLLHVLAADENGLAERTSPIRLAGQVHTPLVLSERRVLVATDRGAIHVYEVDPAGGQNSVREIASVPATARQAVSQYLCADRGRVWAADRRLVMYQLHVARGELAQQWSKDEGDEALAPLLQQGDLVFHARRPRGASGVSVAAIRVPSDEGPGQDAQRVWQTELAVPLAGDVIPDAQHSRASAVTSRGAVFHIDDAALQRGNIDQPAQRAETGAQTLSFGHGTALPEGRWAYASVPDSRRLLVFDPHGDSSLLHLRDVPFSVDGDILPPIALGGALLYPTQAGPVFLVDWTKAAMDLLPFQPRLVPGSRIDWQRPTAVDEQTREFVIADATGALYRVGLKAEPRPNLSPLAQSDLDAEVVAPLATIGPTGYVVLSRDDRQILAAFRVSDLSPGEQWPLEGRVTWGPERVADVVLTATDAEGLICVQADSQRRWTAPLDHGPLAGKPLYIDDCFVLASVTGAVWRIEAASGQLVPWGAAAEGRAPTKFLELGEPLGAGPIAWGRRLLVAGRDGTVHVTDLPKWRDVAAEVGRSAP